MPIRSAYNPAMKDQLERAIEHIQVETQDDGAPLKIRLLMYVLREHFGIGSKIIRRIVDEIEQEAAARTSRRESVNAVLQLLRDRGLRLQDQLSVCLEAVSILRQDRRFE